MRGVARQRDSSASVAADAEDGAGSSGPSTLKHTVSTQLAGAVSTLAFYPFDTLRVRFMSQDGTAQRQHNGQTYRSVGRALALVYREEGLSVLFRGCHVAVLGSVTAWGVYMFTYRSLCDIYNLNNERGGTNDFFVRTALSSAASCVTAVTCNPVFLLKTRMQIEDASCRRSVSSASSGGNYVSFFGGARHAVRSDGFFSLWRGVSAQILLGLPNALNFPLYESLKQHYLLFSSCDKLTASEVCLCSIVAKSTVLIFSHPIYVLKVRLQDQRSRCGETQYLSLLQSTALVLRTSGLRGLYRGIVPSFLQAVPRLMLTFVLYEKFIHLRLPW
ncbi:putative Mitochondrial carrier protein [Trypanosoma vivax]|uniref:Putative mitochondrial carrier protein n=1 Tax=Trypanosoma vivax (strain Y486) TaxID=1055687 RepID=G0U8U9_TRYVY|nr:putative Mitochondrial carrier protein [Trypanosoma vivax]CCC54031.1 putative mitochondrial carrier protein [Trypanosoma vivax Y486]